MQIQTRQHIESLIAGIILVVLIGATLIALAYRYAPLRNIDGTLSTQYERDKNTATINANY